MIKKIFKKDSVCKVTFSLPKEAADSAKSVAVVGDFNDWQPTPLKKAKDGSFALEFELNTGQNYEFRYVIDENKWENDWDADDYVASPYTGVDNSVVKVPTMKILVPGNKTTKASAKKATAKKTVKVAAKKTAAPKKATAKKTVKVAAKTAAPKKATVKVAAKKTAAPKKATAKKTVKVAAKKTAAPKKATAKKTVKVAAKKTAAPKKATAKKTVTKIVKAVKDDLRKIEGIGAKIAEHLTNAGIKTFEELGKAKIKEIQAVLDAAGPRYRMHKPNTWPKQAKLAAKGQWDKLKELQDILDGGKVVK